MTESCPAGSGITVEVAVASARRTLASVADEARLSGYYSGARTGIINAHAELRAALDMLVKAVSQEDLSDQDAAAERASGQVRDQAPD